MEFFFCIIGFVWIIVIGCYLVIWYGYCRWMWNDCKKRFDRLRRPTALQARKSRHQTHKVPSTAPTSKHGLTLTKTMDVLVTEDTIIQIHYFKKAKEAESEDGVMVGSSSSCSFKSCESPLHENLNTQ